MSESRKDKERAKRRELLLEAAERVFGKKPFDEATMQEVAAQAQIGMQGLYEHFPSKQELYEGLVLQRAQAFQEKAARVTADHAEPLDQLRALAAVYVETFRDRPAFLPVFLQERVHYDWGFTSRFGPKIHAVYRLERGRLRSIMERAVRKRILKPMDTEFLTQLCMDVLHSSLYYQHRHRPGEEVATCVNRAMTCFLSGAGERP